MARLEAHGDGDWEERTAFLGQSEREQEPNVGGCKSMWNIPLPAAVLLVAMAVTICILAGAIVVTPNRLTDLDVAPKHCQALLIVIRHAEKPKNAKEPGASHDLSKVGEERAEYLGRCLSHTSPALPWGPPSVLMSVVNQSNGSRRSYDTLIPTSKSLGKKIIRVQDDDYEGLIAALDEHVGCGETVVVAWHHSTMMELVDAVMPTNFWMYKKWPKECDAEGWSEPDWLPGSKCYDIMLSMPLHELPHKFKKKGEKRWIPGWMDIYHEGFGGSRHSKCAEDLSKLDEVTQPDAASGPGRREVQVAGAEAEMRIKAQTAAAMNELHEAMTLAIDRVDKAAPAPAPGPSRETVKIDVVLQ